MRLETPGDIVPQGLHDFTLFDLSLKASAPSMGASFQAIQVPGTEYKTNDIFFYIFFWISLSMKLKDGGWWE